MRQEQGANSTSNKSSNKAANKPAVKASNSQAAGVKAGNKSQKQTATSQSTAKAVNSNKVAGNQSAGKLSQRATGDREAAVKSPNDKIEGADTTKTIETTDKGHNATPVPEQKGFSVPIMKITSDPLGMEVEGEKLGDLRCSPIGGSYSSGIRCTFVPSKPSNGSEIALPQKVVDKIEAQVFKLVGKQGGKLAGAAVGAAIGAVVGGKYGVVGAAAGAFVGSVVGGVLEPTSTAKDADKPMVRDIKQGAKRNAGKILP